MKCRLKDESYCDESFQIEFNSLQELEELRDSLTSMIKYVKLCKEDSSETPDLIYRIAKFGEEDDDETEDNYDKN